MRNVTIDPRIDIFYPFAPGPIAITMATARQIAQSQQGDWSSAAEGLLDYRVGELPELPC